MKNAWIYDRVQALVKKYGTRDPEALLSLLHIHLQYMGATKSLLGMYKVILRQRFIFLPENVGSLKNVVLAHELGHDQLHRQQCLRGAAFHENRLWTPVNQYEMEANIFAAHLLISDQEALEWLQAAWEGREPEADGNLLQLKWSEMAKMRLLEGEPGGLQRPESAFLKRYKPRDDDWGVC